MTDGGLGDPDAYPLLVAFASVAAERDRQGLLRRVSDGSRTRDRRDHNPELYQLSYAHRGATESTSGSATPSLAGSCWLRIATFRLGGVSLAGRHAAPGQRDSP